MIFSFYVIYYKTLGFRRKMCGGKAGLSNDPAAASTKKSLERANLFLRVLESSFALRVLLSFILFPLSI